MQTFGQFRVLNEKVSPSQMKDLEKYLDKLFNEELGLGIDFSKHFKERVNDPRSKEEHGKEIMVGDLRRIFRDTMREYKDKLSKLSSSDEGHMIKVSSQLNIPFVIKRDKNGDLDLVPKTVVMRKKDWVEKAKPKDNKPVYKTQ